MILWVNGTFGVGKTTTARALVEREPRLRFFDPEWVGYLLREHLADVEVTDFQQYPSWRRLVPLVADELVRATGQDLLAVQSVLVEEYWHELSSGLAALGHEVVHVVLEAEAEEVRRRIDADQIEVGAAGWRHRHLEVFDEARPWLVAAADLVVDTTSLTPEGAAGRIASVLGHSDLR